MQIQVRYFAVLRERLGCEAEALELPAAATVADAIDQLAARHPDIGPLRSQFRAAVNQMMVPASEPLRDGDELALIPPVAGGQDAPRLACIVADRPPSLDRCLAAVTGPGMGAAVTFTGMVRDHNDGHTVVRLEYEAYEEMANKVLAELCEAIEQEIEGARMAVEHRVGRLTIGDLAVVIAAAAPHRDEAFRACRALIERLKKSVPIWKKEFSPDGAEWLGVGP